MPNKDNVKSDPIISVIVPIYKVEKYIKKCVDSILAQTYTNLEIILVDDGSPDRCAEICDGYAKANERVKVIHQPNAGLSEARNSGLAIAAGAYIGFVDSDDYIAPTMYETLLSALDKNDADIVICRYVSINESGEIMPQFDLPGNKKYTSKQVFDIFCRERMGLPYFICSWNKLYKKELFSGLKFEKGRFSQDLLMMPYVFEKCGTIEAIEDKLYYYLVRSDNITNTKSIKHEIDETHAYLSLCGYLKKRGFPTSLPLQAAFMRLARAYSWVSIQDQPKLEELYILVTRGLIDEMRGCALKLKIQNIIFCFTLQMMRSKIFHNIGLLVYSVIKNAKNIMKNNRFRKMS